MWFRSILIGIATSEAFDSCWRMSFPIKRNRLHAWPCFSLLNHYCNKRLNQWTVCHRNAPSNHICMFYSEIVDSLMSMCILLHAFTAHTARLFNIHLHFTFFLHCFTPLINVSSGAHVRCIERGCSHRPGHGHSQNELLSAAIVNLNRCLCCNNRVRTKVF